MSKSFKKQVTYLLKKVVNQPASLDTAKCDNYLKRMQEIMRKTDY